MKRIAFWIGTALVCLILANLILTMALSFRNEQWAVEYFDVRNPNHAIGWPLVASAVALTIGLAAWLRHRWKFGAVMTIIATMVVGIWFAPIVLTGWDIFFYPNEDMLTYGLRFQNIFTAREWMVGYAVVTVIAALLGIAFGQHLMTSATPGSPQPQGTSLMARLRARIPWRRREEEPPALLEASDRI
ncbi:MAG: hypothetical protein HY474_00340 [Candidatus Sungbacteria bacterium]|uniref:Uncharacterized protein n=1 Tax=Candidatus Sungiibacteriota bacterium TaxID=2750080 RepID=A0A932YVF0_9BACT|nr:hypothetical protein [Candidatus Sungbacteria bacterium]